MTYPAKCPAADDPSHDRHCCYLCLRVEVQSLHRVNEALLAAVKQAYPTLHYYGNHQPGLQHVYPKPSRHTVHAALLAALEAWKLAEPPDPDGYSEADSLLPPDPERTGYTDAF